MTENDMADSDEVYRAVLDGEISQDEAVKRLRVIYGADRRALRRRVFRAFLISGVVMLALTAFLLRSFVPGEW